MKKHPAPLILALPLLMAAGCSVERDEANDSTSLEINEERLEDVGADVANAAEDVAEGAGNIAEATGVAIENEVGDGDEEANRSEAGNAN